MIFGNKKIDILDKAIKQLTQMIEEANIHEWMYVLGSKKEIIKRNLLAGISRGIGIGIGITIISAILVILLQKIVSLNIPVIGEFVADIVDIVEKNK